jgi:hypothetical protein
MTPPRVPDEIRGQGLAGVPVLVQPEEWAQFEVQGQGLLEIGYRDSYVDGDSDGDRLCYGYKGRAADAVTGYGAGTTT